MARWRSGGGRRGKIKEALDQAHEDHAAAAECLLEILRPPMDTVETEARARAAAVLISEGIHELRLIRKALTTKG